GSVGVGLMPTVLTRRKRPVRPRSAATTSLTDWGWLASPARGITAMGIWRPPLVVMSMVSCAWAPSATSNAPRTKRIRIMGMGRSRDSALVLDIEVKVAESGKKFRVCGRNRQRGGAPDGPFDGGVVGAIAARMDDRDVENLSSRKNLDAHLDAGLARHRVGHVGAAPDFIPNLGHPTVDGLLAGAGGLLARALGLLAAALLLDAPLVVLALLLGGVFLLFLLLGVVLLLLLQALALLLFLL